MHCICLDKELIRFPWLQEDSCENFVCSFSNSPGGQNPDMGPVAGHQQSYAPVRESGETSLLFAAPRLPSLAMASFQHWHTSDFSCCSLIPSILTLTPSPWILHHILSFREPLILPAQ